MTTGTVFDIKEFAVFDGPGIRTTVFLKGCPLRCQWCHNPEGLSPKPQLMVSRAACVHCGACERVCKHPDKCIACGDCVSVCRLGLRKIAGTVWTAEALAGRLMRDKDVYSLSGGGVTERMVGEEKTFALARQRARDTAMRLAIENGAEDPVVRTSEQIDAPEIEGSRKLVEARFSATASGRPRIT